jgi:hypothetical protein
VHRDRAVKITSFGTVTRSRSPDMESSPAASSTGKRPLEPDTEAGSRKKRATERNIVLSGPTPAAILSRFSEFREAEKLIDVTVTCGALQFPCHRNVLAAGSGYFLALFESHFSDSESATCNISTEDIEPEALKQSIDYLYCGKLERCCEEDLQPLGAAASYLRIDPLLQSVWLSMKSRLTIANCVSTWTFADKYSLNGLCSAALEFAARNFQAMATEGGDDVTSGNSLTMLPFTLITDLLAKENLRPRSEQIVFNVALSWLRAQRTTPAEADAAKLWGCVRFALLPRESADQLFDEPLLAHPSCREVLLKSFIPAAYGGKPPHRFPDTVEAAKNLGFSVQRCLVEEMPKETIFELCSPITSTPRNESFEVITASGLLGTLSCAIRTDNVYHYRQTHRTEYHFTPRGGGASDKVEIALDQARRVEWKQ